MKTAVTAVLVAVLLAGCGSDDDGDEKADSGTVDTAERSDPPVASVRFRSPAIGFTFLYPKNFVRETPAGVLAQVAPRRREFFNAIKVRQAADRELAPERYIEDFRRDFERRVARVEKRMETVGELEIAVLEFRDSHRRKGRATDFTSTSYFFAGAGRTWQVECVAEPKREARIDAACRRALESVRFKRQAP